MWENINAFDKNETKFKTTYDSTKHRHSVNVNSKKISNLTMLFDCGADTTVISKHTIMEVLHMSIDELNEKLVTSFTKRIGFANSTSIETKIYPCCILNARIDNLQIPKLFFYITDENTSDLLGNDFIDYCKLSKESDSAYQILDFDYSSYEADFCNKNSFNVNHYLDELTLNYFGGD